MSDGKPRTPLRLASAGRSLWREVVDLYELRVDELRLLEQAARTLDLISRMQSELDDGVLMVTGSMGQTRPHPMLTEIRGHRTVLAALLKQLGLPDEDAVSASRRGQNAAAARWNRGA